MLFVAKQLLDSFGSCAAPTLRSFGGFVGLRALRSPICSRLTTILRTSQPDNASHGSIFGEKKFPGGKHASMDRDTDIEISPPTGEDERRWLTQLWRSEWSGDTMVSRAHVYYLAELKSLIAKTGAEFVGAATYRFDGEGGCELMSINATGRGAGVGTKLLATVEGEAHHAGCGRIWLITSNDNLDALRFYQRRGYRITSVHTGAIDEARRIRPLIPIIGDYGIEIHDEIELAKSLRGGMPNDGT